MNPFHQHTVRHTLKLQFVKAFQNFISKRTPSGASYFVLRFVVCVQLCVSEHLCVRDIKWKEGKTSEQSNHVFCVIICQLWTDSSHSHFDVISPHSLSHRHHDICEEIHFILPSSYLQEYYIVSSKPALQINSPRTYHVSPPRCWILFLALPVKFMLINQNLT